MRASKDTATTSARFSKQLILVFSVFLLFSSFLVLALAYMRGPGSVFDGFEALASFIFWIAVLALLVTYPLRRVLGLFSNYMKRPRGAIAFVTYISVHLLLYGLILEGIIIYTYKFPSLVSQTSIIPSSVLIYPVSAASMLEDLAFNPSLNFAIPPGYSLSLSLYSFVIALVIAILVVTNVMRVAEVSSSCPGRKRSVTLFGLPLIGVLGGATCCLSLPFLIYLLAPITAVVSNSIGAYYVAYIGFPFLTAIALKYNLESINRMSKLSVSVKESKV